MDVPPFHRLSHERLQSLLFSLPSSQLLLWATVCLVKFCPQKSDPLQTSTYSSSGIRRSSPSSTGGPRGSVCEADDGRPGSPNIFLVPAKPVNDVNVLSDLCMGVRHHGAADVDDFGLDVLLFLFRDAMEPEAPLWWN